MPKKHRARCSRRSASAPRSDPQVVVRAQGRWLSRDRLRPGRRRAPAVASRHRPDTRPSRRSSPSSRAQAVDSHDPRRRDRRARCATGRPSFNALQNRAAAQDAERDRGGAAPDAPVVFLCFDLLHFAGLNLRGAPYIDRRRYLSQCLLPSTHFQLVHVSDDAETLYAAALDSGFEGIVAKRKDSTYQPGRRSTAWLKIKAIADARSSSSAATRRARARARPSARCCSATGKATSCTTSATSARASTTRSRGPARAPREAHREDDLRSPRSRRCIDRRRGSSPSSSPK